MFDYNMILIDGTINLTATTDTPAIATDRDAATGAAVIDLGPGGTPSNGLAAVLILPTAAVASSTLTGFIEASDTVDMTGTTTGISELGKFGVASATKGVILAEEVVASTIPVIVVMRIATEKRYIRANLTVNNTTGSYNFYKVKCYLTPFPFTLL